MIISSRSYEQIAKLLINWEIMEHNDVSKLLFYRWLVTYKIIFISKTNFFLEKNKKKGTKNLLFPLKHAMLK